MPQFNSFVYDTSVAYTPDVIRGDCYAIFRLSSEYKEEGAHFGFDWLRTGDALGYVKHDVPYLNNVGRNFKGFIRFPEHSDDIDINFREDEQMYQSLRHSYLPGNISIFPSATGRREDYHTPVLSIYPKDKVAEPAKLVLEINIMKEPKHIHLSYDKTLFDIQGADSLPCEPGKHKCNIEITCQMEIQTDVYIYVLLENDKGEDKLAGIMRVWKNDKSSRKSLKVLLINTKFLESDEADSPVITGNPDIIKASLEQFLPHALIKPTIQELDCDLGFNLEFRKRLIRVNGELCIISYEESEALGPSSCNNSCIQSLDDFFIDYLAKLNINTLDYHVFIISLGLKLCMLSNDGGIIEQGGYACNQYVFLENVIRKSIPVHECLHVLGLNHTFNNKHNDGQLTDYTYKVGITDNLMDYAHLFGVKMVNWWEWQWIKAREKLPPED